MSSDKPEPTVYILCICLSMQVKVSVGDELRFKVFFNHDNLDIVWSDVSRFNHPSHGILGTVFAYLNYGLVQSFNSFNLTSMHLAHRTGLSIKINIVTVNPCTFDQCFLFFQVSSSIMVPR